MHSKLGQIAKLSGSFSLAAGATQWSKSSDSESSWVSNAASSLLLPSTGQCFSLLGSSGVSKSVRLTPIKTTNAAGETLKIYPVALRISPISSQFTVSNLRLACLRGAIFAYFPFLESYFRELQEAEERANQEGREFGMENAPEFDWEGAKERLPFAALSVVKEILVGIVKVLLSWATAVYVDDRLAWKLIKEQSSSLCAKVVVPFYLRPYRVLKTVVRGSVIPALAEFLVSYSIELIRVSREKGNLEKKMLIAARRGAAFAFRSLILLVSGAVGAGVISAVRPGFLCTISALLTQFAVDTFVCVPEVQYFLNRGLISPRLKWLLLGCTGVIALSFWDWVRSPARILSTEEVVPAFALQ